PDDLPAAPEPLVLPAGAPGADRAADARPDHRPAGGRSPQGQCTWAPAAAGLAPPRRRRPARHRGRLQPDARLARLDLARADPERMALRAGFRALGLPVPRSAASRDNAPGRTHWLTRSVAGRPSSFPLCWSS